MAITAVFKFLFPISYSPFLLVLSVISFVTIANTGLLETRGKHLQYSKFWSINSNGSSLKRIPSKTGMIFSHIPAFLIALTTFWILPHQSFRIRLLKIVLTLHFFKEVLFIHKYSGYMALDIAIMTPISYLSTTATIVYAHNLTQTFSEPPIDLLYPGIALFLIGISGNFYHHYLLSKLRAKGEKEYKIPKSGLSDLVICPHYLFEMIEFWGISFISQTLFAFNFTIGSTFYLMGRSISTRRWYLSKFEDFPKNVKAIIPFVL